MKKRYFLGCLYFLGMLSYGQELQLTEQLDEIVITDSRFAIKKEQSGKTIIKIDSVEINRFKGQTLAGLINAKSGIIINGSQSQAGQTLSTFIRGGQNRQVLVLIDGVPVSDPSQIENNFDLQLLSPDLIESIEILKGASSALYGTRASTAVINVILKKSGKEKINANFSSFIGTNNSQVDQSIDVTEFTNALGVNGTLNKFNYLFSFTHRSVDGLSAIASDNSNTLNDADPFNRYGLLLRTGYQLSDNFNASFGFSFDTYTTAFDDSFGFVDANNISNNEFLKVNHSSTFEYGKGSLILNAALSNSEREFESSFPTRFDANSFSVDLYNKYKITEQLLSVIGISYVDTEMDSYSIPFGGNSFSSDINSDNANDLSIDPYVNFTYLSDIGFNINAGARLNNHSEYGSQFVYHVNPSYLFSFDKTQLKVFGSIGSAFITPSLFQLFAPGFGNVDLVPQEDQTIEIGGAFSKNQIFELSALFFSRNQTNMIDYVVTDPVTFAGEYQNLSSEVNVNGVEVELNLRPSPKVELNTNYSFTDVKEGQIFRIPKHRINSEVRYTISSKTELSAQFQFNSERVSPFLNDEFTDNRILDAYSLVHLNFRQKLSNDKIQVYATITNLLNEEYQELYRFSTLGRNYRIGMSLSF